MTLIYYNNNIKILKKNKSYPVIITFQGFSRSHFISNKNSLPFYMFNSLTNDTTINANIIFVRDVEQCWYLTGYDNNNTHVDFLNDLKLILDTNFKNNKIITVGQSAGGFAALLFGSLLTVNNIIVFNPQTSCYKGMDIPCQYTCDPEKPHHIIKKKSLENLIDKSFYNLKNHISNNIKIDYYIGDDNYDNIMLNNLLDNKYNNINVIKKLSDKYDKHCLVFKKDDYINIIKKEI